MKKDLTPEQKRILIDKGTEMPFSGEFWAHTERGKYFCAGCGTLLFDSSQKYNSGCGWPSFFDEVGNIETRPDNSHSMKRTEIVCKNCGGHLGHLFDDGPKPTKKRYCVNSLALEFEK